MERAGVLVFRAGVGDAADGNGEEGVGVGEGGGVVAEELSAWGSASGAGERTAADVPGAGTRVFGDKAERDGLDAGGEGETRGGAAQGGKRLRYGRRHLFLQLTRGWKRQAEERGRMKIVRGARHVGGGPRAKQILPPRKWSRHHFCHWLVCEVQCFMNGVCSGGGSEWGGKHHLPPVCSPPPPPPARSTDFGMSSWPNFLYGESDTSCKSWLTLTRHTLSVPKGKERQERAVWPSVSFSSRGLETHTLSALSVSGPHSPDLKGGRTKY